MRPIPTAALIALLAAAAAAQSVLRELDKIGLTNDEVRAATAAGQTLYAGAEIAKPGTAATWRTENGGAGQVVLMATTTRADGAACVELRHDGRSSKGGPIFANQRRCRGADGVWRIAVE